jgi:hypothetical protein
VTKGQHSKESVLAESGVKRRCIGKVKSTGLPCRNDAHDDSEYCWSHDPDPEAQAKMQEARHRGGENRHKKKARQKIEKELISIADELATFNSLETRDGLWQFINELAVRSKRVSPENDSITAGVRVANLAIEAKQLQLEERIQGLEIILGARQQSDREAVFSEY